MKRRCMLSQYMRLQNLANEEFGEHRPVGRLRAAVSEADRPQRNQGNARREVRRRADSRKPTPAIRRNSTTSTAPQNKLRVPMHYVLKNDAAHHLGKAPLPYGKVRIFIEGAGENAQVVDRVPRRRLGQVHAQGR